MHAPWKRDATVFLGSQALSLLGSALVQYALLWHVTLQTRSGVMMTLYIVAGFLPTFLLSPFAGVWADRYFHNRMRTMVASNLVMGACTVGLGLVPFFGVYLAVMSVFGLALPLYNTPATVMLQEHVEPAFLGRVFGVMTMLSTSLMPLSMLLFGPLAEAVSIERLLQVTGALVVLLGLLAPLHRRLMAFGEQRPEAPPAATGDTPTLTQ